MAPDRARRGTGRGGPRHAPRAWAEGSVGPLLLAKEDRRDALVGAQSRPECSSERRPSKCSSPVERRRAP